MSFRLAIAMVGAFVTLLFALRRVNLPRAERHRQLWAPAAAAILALGCGLALQQLLSVTLSLLNWIPFAGSLMATVAGVAGMPVLLVANVLLIGVFTAVKAAVLLPTRKLGPGQRALSPFHTLGAFGEAVLDLRFAFMGRALRASGYALAIAILLAIPLSAFLPGLSWPLLLPVASMLVLLELGWLLDGTREDRPTGDLVAAGSRSKRLEDYEKLYRHYLKTWPDRVLATAVLRRDAKRSLPAGVDVGRSADEAEERWADTVWRSILAKGHRMSWSDRGLLKLLLGSEDLLVGEPSADRLSPLLGAAMRERLRLGNRILVLVDTDQLGSPARLEFVAEWLHSAIDDAEDLPGLWRVEALSSFRTDGQADRVDVLVGSTHEILAEVPALGTWLSELGLLLVLNATGTLMAHLPTARAAVRVIEDRAPYFKLVVVSDARRGLESGVRDIFPGDSREHGMRVAGTAHLFAIVWRLEGDKPFQAETLGELTFLGAEPVLGVEAWRQGILPIVAVGQENEPWDEFMEELAGVSALKGEGFAADVMRNAPVSWLAPEQERGVVLVRDRECNVLSAIREYGTHLRTIGMLHVVSPPYLLRDYFAHNLDYFLALKDAPAAIVPRIADSSSYSAAYLLFERLVNAPVSEREIVAKLQAVNRSAALPEAALGELFQETFGTSLREQTTWEEVFHLSQKNGDTDFVAERRLWLDRAVRELELPWLRLLELVDSGGNVQGAISADHADQLFLVGHVCAMRSRVGDDGFASKPYRVQAIDRAAGRIRTEHAPASDVTAVRATRRVHLKTCVPEPFRRETVAERGGWQLTLSQFSASFSIETNGFLEFSGAVSREAGRVQHRPFPRGASVRDYSAGRVLVLAIQPPIHASALESLQLRRLSRTLAVLLSEMLPTLYPETHRLLAVTPLLAEGEVHEAGTWDHVLAHFKCSEEAERIVMDAAQIRVGVFEDSHADMGLLGGLMSDAESEWIFDLLEDYLVWVASAPEPGASGAWTRPNAATLDPKEFLRYGAPDVSDSLDLEGLLQVLEGLRGNQDRLRHDRARFRAGDHPLLRIGQRQGERLCDFCGDNVTGSHEKLDDGRERCDLCSGTALQTPAQLESAYREARKFMEKDLGVSELPEDITVSFASAAEIAGEFGWDYTPTAGMDARAVGVASCTTADGQLKLRIHVENGAPYRMAISTLVHELTHIWQFRHLDTARMRYDYGLLLIEGHATWSHVAWLERTGIDREQARDWRRRTDEYGEGLRVLEKMMEEANAKSPFDFLRTLYGRG